RDHRARAGPEVLSAVLDLGRSVVVDRDRRPRSGTAGVVPDGRADADALQDLGVRRLPARVTVLPADLPGAHAELLPPHGGGIVVEADRGGSPPARLRGLVHRAREREGPRGVSWRAHGGARPGFGEAVVPPALEFVAGIDVLDRSRGARPAVGAAVAV